ncbi:MAG: hypothetical protein ACON4T_05425 [Synechococcus sp.]
MDSSSDQHQPPPPQWDQMVEAAARTKLDDNGEVGRLRERVKELEANVADYEALLAELPEVFERKFQQRLEPLLERYRLLALAEDIREVPRTSLRRAALRLGLPGMRRIGSTPDDKQDETA